ncbi:hypothetical protein IT397_03650 [Candidatus Nomurabacteria bacterium]|nr:hypothetical protein [Candidatus Nomurabacteria bacterium]
MGPILIFDKSALQSFSIDESVWLDNFFFTNITPIFYVETLADLSLSNAKKPPEKIISELAAKTPDALPNVHHGRLILGNFLGIPVEVKHGRPIVDQGKTKRAPNGEIGVEFDESPEAIALRRWHKGQYHEVEREFANEWRNMLRSLSFDNALGIVKNILPRDQRLTTLEQIKVFVESFIDGNSRELFFLSFDFLGIPDNRRPQILARWEKEGRPTLQHFAPYAAYVLSIDLLFYIAALRGIISGERPSNKVDMAYLYYLPFCHVFVSGDKLHAKTAPLFMGVNQKFVKASDLKEGLAKLNNYYLQFSDEIEEVGVMRFAQSLPPEIQTVIHDLWDANKIPWRRNASKSKKSEPLSKESERELLEKIKRFSDGSQAVDPKILENMDDADHVVVKHRVSLQKGRWRILPKDIENQESD